MHSKMKYRFGIWIYFVPLVLCTNVASLAQIPKKRQDVDRVFLKQLFRPQLEWMSKYTIESCRNLDVEFNVTEAFDNFNVCIDKKLMPRVIGRTPEYFDRMRLALAKLPKMESIQDFLPWKDELEKMCDVIPDLSNCFLDGFLAYINGCWEVYHRSIYGYLNNLSRSLCNSQRGIRGLFTPKYLHCLDKYAKSVMHCARQSHVQLKSLCGLIPCLRQFVPKCGIPKVDDFLSRILTTSQKHSDCPIVPYIFPIQTITPPPVVGNTTLSLTTKVIEPEVNSDEPIPMDVCTILEGKLETLYYNDSSDLVRFFAQLDSICANWSATDCNGRPADSGWTPFLVSQCINSLSPVAEPNETMNRCIGSSFGTRVDRLSTFCKAQKAFPGMGESQCNKIVEGFRNSSGEIEFLGDLLDEILDECRSGEPLAAAARKAEDVGPLIWGLVFLPVGIILISVSVHYMTKDRKETSGEDVDSDSSLISIDTKDPNFLDIRTIQL